MVGIALATLAGCAASARHDPAAFDIQSVRSGAWSEAATWQPARPPQAGDRVLIPPGHEVVFDVVEPGVIRSIALGGTLGFARDRDTELNVGLVTIYGAGQVPVPDDVDAGDAHAHHAPVAGVGGALEVGTPALPIPAPFTARIRLHAVEGMDPSAAPALICRPGGRMDLHGAPLSRTWVKLGAPAAAGDVGVTLAEAPTGWRAGDEVIVTGAAQHDASPTSSRARPAYGGTEQRRIVAIDGATLTLDAPLAVEHYGSGPYRSEVANLSRSVIVESATPDGVRGHTMYHRYGRGSISYARFAHLGKQGTIGRYPIHFHRVADTMRGSSVIGAAIVDSHNRWITIHGTEYLVVRDCVGFESIGHGFFLEDATEVYNVLDRNLGVRAYAGARLKNQALFFDRNEGAAFWWANGRNTLTRNVSCENDHYGYRYESRTGLKFDSHLPVRGVDGVRTVVDVRALPIYRFQHNESHTEALYSFSLTATDLLGNEGYPVRTPLDAPPDDGSHPHVLKDLTAWQTRYGLHAELPSMWIENVTLDHAEYGVYRPWFDRQVYKNLRIAYSNEPFNRGLDDYSLQQGSITVDGLEIVTRRTEPSLPIIQISDDNVSGRAESHFRRVAVREAPGEPASRPGKPLVNRGGGPRPTPTTAHGVPVYLHDFFGPGRDAKIVSTAARDFGADGLRYRELAGITGDESRIAEVTHVAFPRLLTPRDDQPPATVITFPTAGIPVRLQGGSLTVTGTSTDDVRVQHVTVNGEPAQPTDDEFLQWTVTLRGVAPGPLTLTAVSEDAAGNVEQTPHVVTVDVR
ncbi:MAG: G8 domain-containing protein [Deltaproteobacteria bacterium]|nr:G8 domain-containing protein [Deltaproteobacteria bacterium]